MNLDVAQELYFASHVAVTDFETYIADVKEGFELLKKRQIVSAEKTIYKQQELNKMNMALAYNEAAMLRFLLNPA